MNRNYIVLISLIAISFLNCDCPPLDKTRTGIRNQIEASKVIIKVIGISRNFNKYKFKVLTSYKGDLAEGQIVEGEAADNCEMFINPGSTYILFGYKAEYFHTNGCDLSFDVKKPFPLFPPPPPFPVDSIKSSKKEINQKEKWEVKYDFKFANRIIRELNRYKRKHF